MKQSVFIRNQYVLHSKCAHLGYKKPFGGDKVKAAVLGSIQNTQTKCEHHVELLNVKPDGMASNH